MLCLGHIVYNAIFILCLSKDNLKRLNYKSIYIINPFKCNARQTHRLLLFDYGLNFCSISLLMSFEIKL